MENSELDRRDFIKVAGVTAGALAATGVLTGDLLAGGGEVRAPIRKAVKIGMVGEGETLLDKFRLVKELGFDGIELDSPNGLSLEEVIAARDESGLPIHGVVDSVHWGKPLSHPDAKVRDEGRAGLETALRDAKAYGASSVLLVPAVVNRDISYADAYRRSQEEIRKVLPLAEELGIKIAFENVWNGFLLSPLEAARYVDEFESASVGWYFDVGNIVNFGWPHHWIEVLGPRILKLDIKEFSRKRRNDEGLWKGFGVEIGDGDCDWPQVRAALDAIGFAGWATAEVGGGKRDRLADIAARMDRVLNPPSQS